MGEPLYSSNTSDCAAVPVSVWEVDELNNYR